MAALRANMEYRRIDLSSGTKFDIKTNVHQNKYHISKYLQQQQVEKCTKYRCTLRNTLCDDAGLKCTIDQVMVHKCNTDATLMPSGRLVFS